MSDLVPRPILENILSRLPHDAIARCRCVSKLWNALITEPYFVTMRFRQAIENSNNLIRVLFWCARKLYLLACSGTTPSDHKVAQLDPQFVIKNYDHTGILGYCNGLLCVTTKDLKVMNIYLWDPHFSSPEFKQIPIALTPTKKRPPHRISYGFGYNATAKDYQVLRVLSYFSVGCLSEVEVFSLRDNSWTRIQDVPYRLSLRNGKFINGAIHWVGTYSANFPSSRNIIIAYDMHHQSFREVPIPNYDQNRCIHVYLETLLGYLCVNFYNMSFVEMWVMKDYGAKSSWTKLFRIDCADYTLPQATYGWVPLCFVNKGAEILLVNAGCFYMCDTNNNCLREISIQNIPPLEFDDISTYMESNIQLY